MSHWAASLVDPLALVWVLPCAIAAFFSWRRRWPVAGVCGASALVLFLVASLPWPERLVGAMEAPYTNQIAGVMPKPDAVVVLGGMHRPSGHDPFGFALGDSGQRLVAGLEVARQYQGTVLVLGGSGPRPGEALRIRHVVVTRLDQGMAALRWGDPRFGDLHKHARRSGPAPTVEG